jgi:hypothetical protein
MGQDCEPDEVDFEEEEYPEDSEVPAGRSAPSGEDTRGEPAAPAITKGDPFHRDLPQDIPILRPGVYHYLKTGEYPRTVTTVSKRASLRRSASRFVWNFGVLYKKHKSGRLLKVVSPQELPLVWETCHMQSHPGMKGTWQRVSKSYWWVGIEQDCYAFVRTCDGCQKQKGQAARTDRILHPISVSMLAPFHKVGIDMAGPFSMTASGNKYLMVVIDYVSKWIEAFPTPDNKSLTVATIFHKEIICRHGCPIEVTSDGGPTFEKDFMEALEKWGVKSIKISPYNPQANGLVERCIQTLKAGLERCTGSRPHLWDSFLPNLLLSYRNLPQKTSNYSHYYLLHGREAVLPEQLSSHLNFQLMGDANPEVYAEHLAQVVHQLQHSLEHAKMNIMKAQGKQQEDFQIRAKSQTKFIDTMRELPKDSLVLMRVPGDATTALQYQWEGPYRFKGFTSDSRNVAVVEDGQGRQWERRITLLKPYCVLP